MREFYLSHAVAVREENPVAFVKNVSSAIQRKVHVSNGRTLQHNRYDAIGRAALMLHVLLRAEVHCVAVTVYQDLRLHQCMFDMVQ